MTDIREYRKGDRVLRTYIVENVINDGGLGIVYKVRNEEIGYFRAMKVPRSAEHFREFIDECGKWVKP